VFSVTAVERVVADALAPTLAVQRALAAVPLATPPTAPCAPVDDVCSAGALDHCVTGSNTFRLEFDDCLVDIGATDRGIEGAVTGQLEGGGGAVQLDVAVGRVPLDGGIDFDLGGSCIELMPSRVLLETGAVRAGATGTLTSCIGEDWPTGTLYVAARTGDHGDLRLQFELGGTRAADVTVFDLGSDDLLGTCTLDLETGQAGCTPAG
jgi:hypothetical protein